MITYQVGGSLSEDSPNYVRRQADDALCKALLQGEFCYILDSRQMGKSSLLVHTQAHLKRLGGRFAFLDLITLGSQNTTPEEWYQGIGAELCLGFNLLNTKQFLIWWGNQGEVPLLQKLSRFIDQVLLSHYPDIPLYIFVDEVDSVLSLPFSADDWFALIRYCYNQRALDPRYRQLTFAIAGVATPSNLIADKTRTPFNIGRSITLKGLQLSEATALAAGLHGVGGNIQAVLRAVLDWTGGQPFLTQKLCQLLVEISQHYPSKQPNILAGMETAWVEGVVRDHILHDWEGQDEPEHLRTIQDRILRNEQLAGRLLGIYQTLLDGQTVTTNNNPEQIELLLSGLVIRQAGQLHIKNRIYQTVFDANWVTQQLANLRPYSQNLIAWMAAEQTDTSRLLQGQALQDAQQWARTKSLNEVDYQFLAASAALDRDTIQQRLEAARVKEVEARLQQERRATKLQRRLLGVISLALLVTIGLSLTTFWQYRRIVEKQQQIEQETVRTLKTSAKALLASNLQLDALVAAVRAKVRLSKLPSAPSTTELNHQVTAVLRQALFSTSEINRLTGHTSVANDVAFSPNGRTLVSVSPDGTLRFWQQDGALLKTVQVTEDDIYAVDYGSELIAIAEGGNTVDLWSTAGEKMRSLTGHTATVWFVTFGPKGELLASASQDSTVRLWSSDGQLIQMLQGHTAPVYGADISPDQQLIASASTDGTAKIWRRDGQLQATLTGHDGAVWAVAFSPIDDLVVTTGQDQTVRLWQTDGTPIKTLRGHSGAVWGVKFSPDGSFFVSTSIDKTAKVWSNRGSLLNTLRGHEDTVWGIDISPDGQTIATASWDQTVRLWQRRNPLQQTLYAPEGAVTAIDYEATGETFASASLDGVIQLWSQTGELIRIVGRHNTEISSVAISPDKTYGVSSGSNNTAKVWSLEGKLLHTLSDHQDEVYSIDISPDSETIITGDIDGIVKLWHRNGTLERTIDIEQSIYSLEIRPDGQTLATTGSKGLLQLWNLEGQLLHSIKKNAPINTITFHPNGQTLAIMTETSVQLLQINGDHIRTMPLNPEEFSSLTDITFSPDGNILAVTLWNTKLKTWQIKLWNIDGAEIGNLFGEGAITTLAFSPDGKSLASGSSNKTITLWNLEQILGMDELLLACNWIDDYLRTNSEVADEYHNLCTQSD